MRKNGRRSDGTQRYHCRACRRYCDAGIRLPDEVFWNEYLHGKQTCRQLAQRYACSISTVQRRLGRQPDPEGSGCLPSKAVVLLDTTYFGRGFGVVLLKDAATNANLFAAPLKHETNAVYQSAINELEQWHCRVQAVVCDGRRGLFGAFGAIPVQMCQFHQIAIVRRYLTRNPKLLAARQLWLLTNALPRLKETHFSRALQRWQNRWEAFLNERTLTPKTKRSRYSHPRLRSAFLSLKRNLPWLFTCLRYPSLQIPNTTNALDGHFAELKTKIRNHNGLSKKRRQKLILYFLKPALISHFDHYAPILKTKCQYLIRLSNNKSHIRLM